MPAARSRSAASTAALLESAGAALGPPGRSALGVRCLSSPLESMEAASLCSGSFSTHGAVTIVYSELELNIALSPPSRRRHLTSGLTMRSTLLIV
jgi:hypothetical protein